MRADPGSNPQGFVQPVIAQIGRVHGKPRVRHVPGAYPPDWPQQIRRWPHHRVLPSALFPQSKAVAVRSPSMNLSSRYPIARRDELEGRFNRPDAMGTDHLPYGVIPFLNHPCTLSASLSVHGDCLLSPPHISLMIYKWNEAQSATRQDFAGCFQFTPGEQPGIKPSFFHTDGANMSRTATMAPAKIIRRPTISLAAGSRCWTSSPNVAAKSVSTEIS